MFAYLYVCAACTSLVPMLMPVEAKDSVRALGTGAMESCEAPRGAGNRTLVLGKSN